MAPDPLDDDSEYDSSEDSDFAPEAVPVVASDDSSDPESEDGKKDRSNTKSKGGAGKRKRKKAVAIAEAEDVGFENSGDEEIVERGLKRQRKKGRKSNDDDEGGEGGFVKTRRMAALAPDEKRPLASTASATVDVDALWASMISGSIETPAGLTSKDSTPSERSDSEESPEPLNEAQTQNDNSVLPDNPGRLDSKELDGDDKIMIRRTYNFAGKVHNEEKLVSRDSAEAQLWLQSQSSSTEIELSSDSNFSKPLRPPRKARRSIFEPITETRPQRADLQFGVSALRTGNGLGTNGVAAAKKLSTVEKSKMDWAGFVDKEGIKDELKIAGKSKGAYLDQREFLARVEDKREEDARKARLKA